jgi:hypothetical protein
MVHHATCARNEVGQAFSPVRLNSHDCLFYVALDLLLSENVWLNLVSRKS